MATEKKTRRPNGAGSVCEFTDESGRQRFKIGVTAADGEQLWKRMKPGCKRAEAEREAASWPAKLAADPDFRPQPVGGETFSKWFARRSEARRAKLSSVSDDESRFVTWIEPYKCADGATLGDKAMACITTEDLEGLVEHLDDNVNKGKLRWKTAINVWAVITGSFRDACRSKVKALRVRKDNPAAGIEGPDRGGERSKVFVYPSEHQSFVEREATPLLWRRLEAVGIYLGARAGELEALEWEDIDLPHGKVTIHRTIDREENDEGTETKIVKDKEPRTFGIELNLLPLLRVMHDETGGKGRVFPEFPRLRDLADELRRYMKLAGVTRPELYVSDETRINLRFHDLRASTVTWMGVRGDSTERIMQRVGHEDWPTMKKYLRTAEALSEGFGDVFPPLPESLLCPVPKPVPNTPQSLRGTQVLETIAGRTGLENERRSHHAGKRSSSMRATSTTASDNYANPDQRSGSGVNRSSSGVNVDRVEADLRAGLARAAFGGNGRLVEILDRRLTEHLEARAGNVVALDSRRKKP